MARFKLAILIPHFNNPRGLYKTLESLKSSNGFELVVVDDGSDIEQRPIKASIVEALESQDVHLHVLRLKINQGVEHALNEGLQFIRDKIKPEYILRVDCGDRCINNRIDIQTLFLDKHPDICLVGSWVEYVDDTNQYLFTLKLPLTHEKIKKRMLVRVSFIHSAVMFRTSALDKVGWYTDKYKAAEDYSFFYKFIKNCKTANIKEVLTEVEWNSHGISVKKRRQQLVSRLRLTFENAQVTPIFIYGICRLLILLVMPYKVVETIKKKVYK